MIAQISRIFSNIKLWIFSKNFFIDHEANAFNKSATSQENERDRESVKKFSKSFEVQQEKIQLRSMKAHDATCIDILSCTKIFCFKSEPDKIVSSQEVPISEVKPKRIRRKPTKELV